MGYQLRRAYRDVIRAQFPVGYFTPGELHVLMEIADLANDTTRIAQFGPEQVARMCNLTPQALIKRVQRLAAKGIEIRQQVGTDRLGRPVYAHRGRQTNYAVPDPATFAAVDRGWPDVAVAAERVDEWVDNLSGKGGQPVSNGWTDRPPHLLSNPHTPSVEDEDARLRQQKIDKKRERQKQKAVASIINRIGSTPLEASKVIEDLTEDYRPTNIAAYIDGCPDDHLEERIETARYDSEIHADAEHAVISIATVAKWMTSDDLAKLTEAFRASRQAGYSYAEINGAYAGLSNRTPVAELVAIILNPTAKRAA